jgi:hypothetical protein
MPPTPLNRISSGMKGTRDQQMEMGMGLASALFLQEANKRRHLLTVAPKHFYVMDPGYPTLGIAED